jgi:hypothetical protein
MPWTSTATLRRQRARPCQNLSTSRSNGKLYSRTTLSPFSQVHSYELKRSGTGFSRHHYHARIHTHIYAEFANRMHTCQSLLSSDSLVHGTEHLAQRLRMTGTQFTPMSWAVIGTRSVRQPARRIIRMTYERGRCHSTQCSGCCSVVSHF